MALQAHAVDGDALLLQAHGEIIEGCSLSLVAELHAIVIEIEHGIGVSTMGPDERGVDELLADSLCPHTVLPQGIAFRIGTDNRLVIVKTLVYHIPLGHLALIVLHYLLDVVL